MCSLFWQMENDQGDLSDILRVGGSVPTSATTSGNDWSFPAETEIFPTRTSDRIFEDLGDLYGGGAQDRSLHESAIANSMFLSGTNALTLKKDSTSCCFSDGGHGDSIVIGDEIKSSQTLLTRMLQIDPNPKIPIVSVSTSSPRSIKPVSDDLKVKSAGESNENRAGVQQMNSPRNPGIKRRKNQTKKVVCIPAPAAANSRPSGEVVPSDLWAWRKYGQKPIKGSPYPRCSSSKGCSARKQVERSRTDPNMLVITYTSEHNHPWPTQRNALAGSTRTPASKAAGSKASPPPIDHTPNASEEPLKDDQEEIFKENDHGQDESSIGIKQELSEADKFAEIVDGEMGRDAFRHSCHLSGETDDFFLELGELESDPLSLIFPHEFSEEKSSATAENKGTLDPSFGFFDWSNGQSSFVDSRKDS